MESDGWLGARLYCCLPATAQEKEIHISMISERTGVARHNQALAPSYPDTSAEYLIALITVVFGMANVLVEESRVFVIDDDASVRQALTSLLQSVALNVEAFGSPEQEILGLVTAGLMNKQVAAELGVSEITIKVHRGNVMKKMGARSLADLVRMADAIGRRQPKH